MNQRTNNKRRLKGISLYTLLALVAVSIIFGVIYDFIADIFGKFLEENNHESTHKKISEKRAVV